MFVEYELKYNAILSELLLVFVLNLNVGVNLTPRA
jgi:hypothetical protein